MGAAGGAGVGPVRALVPTAALFGLSIAYWKGMSMLSGAAEPWDSPAYAIAYLFSLVIALIAGLVIGRGAWLIGLAISFAQMPVMAWNSSVGPLAAVGIIMLAALALPLMAAAGVGTIVRKRRAH